MGKMFLRIKCCSEEECIELFERLNERSYKWADGRLLLTKNTKWNHRDNDNNFVIYELWDDKEVTRYFGKTKREDYYIKSISYEESKFYNLETGEINEIFYDPVIEEKLKTPNVDKINMIIEDNEKIDTTEDYIERGLSFWKAGEIICENKKYAMRLKSWKEDVYIKMQVPDEYSKMTHPYLYVTSRFGKVPWKETFVEMFSENWEVVEREE